MVNGNRKEGRKSLKIVHWNGGAKFWTNKTEHIECMINELRPDLMFVSEANIFSHNNDYQIDIEGYKIYHPKQHYSLGYSRIILLAREELKIEIQSNLMDDDIASIWLKVVRKGARKLFICGIYREHQLLLQPDPNTTKLPEQQLKRWRTFINRVVDATRNAKCIIIGDTNLDHLKWLDPDQHHKDMVNMMKNEVETLGYSQSIVGPTRFWPGQNSSLIDQCWTNSPELLLSSRNLADGTSDHNPIEIMVRLKGKPNHAK